MKVHVGSGCGDGVGDGLLERRHGGPGEVQHSGACEGAWTQNKCPGSWIMLVLLLVLLRTELVFGLAHLEVGVYLESRPISNNILSKVIAW